MKKVLTFLAVAFITIGSFAQTNWKIDSAHSSLNFDIAHSGISFVNGKFTDYTGEVTTYGEELDEATINFTVQIASINTNVEMRDNHLKSADFFDVETYPTMTFESTKILATGKPDLYLLHGKLTIKDVTKDVIFDVHYGGTVESEEGEKIGIKATTVIDRFDFNIDYDSMALGIGKDVSITVHGQFVKQ